MLARAIGRRSRSAPTIPAGCKTNGAAFCWGSNQYGQLGVAHVDTSCVNAGTSVRVRDSRRRPCSHGAEVRLDQRRAATHLRDHGVARGVLLGRERSGPGWRFRRRRRRRWSAFPRRCRWTQISAGFSHTCAVRTDGALYCWGANDRGQLGIGTITATARGMSASRSRARSRR